MPASEKSKSKVSSKSKDKKSDKKDKKSDKKSEKDKRSESKKSDKKDKKSEKSDKKSSKSVSVSPSKKDKDAKSSKSKKDNLNVTSSQIDMKDMQGSMEKSQHIDVLGGGDLNNIPFGQTLHTNAAGGIFNNTGNQNAFTLGGGHGSLDRKKNCVLHGKPLRYFCDSCEELICYDCTVMGPHNTQLHRISSIDESFKYRFDGINKQIHQALVPKRAQLIGQIVRLDHRLDEIKAVKGVIDKDIRNEYAAIMERLRSAEGVKFAVL